MSDTSNQKWEDEISSLEEMEDEVQNSTCEALFREMCQLWLQQNGLKVLLEEASSKPKPKYRRQNANCFGQK